MTRPPKRLTRPARTALVTVLGLSLITGLTAYVPDATAKAVAGPPPATQPDKSIPGKDFKARAKPAPGKAGTQTPVQVPVWPTASGAVVPLQGLQKGAVRAVASSPVKVGPITTTAAGTTAKAVAGTPTSVKVDVLDQAGSTALGVAGLALRLSRADGQAAAGRTRLQVDYSKFRHAYGGDWSSRLRIVELACKTATSCTTTRVVPGGVNDGKAGVVSADVDLPAAPIGKAASAASTFAVMAAADGPNGSFSASSLSPASTWQVSPQTGDFSWNYPMRVPPGTAGPRPQLAINYSSGSVDGQTASSNSQSSWIGQGHSLEHGFIERKYAGCTDDMAGGNNSAKTGDLCWKSDNATVSLAGHSSELLWDATDGWKLRNDDGSKIVRKTGATNGARNGEYWILTTNDGTEYYFGLNPIAGDPARTNSVLTVPVYGNHDGEPCNAATFAASYCQQAWRWNLDRVVDPHGNVMTYRYLVEDNYYGRNNNTGVSEYQRASYLTRIEYAERAGTDQAGSPPAWVDFTVAERCIPSGAITCAEAQRTQANASHWPDTPIDQICTSSTTCVGKTSPSFFTTKRLATVNTRIWQGGVRNVDSWTLTQTFEEPGDGTGKILWLKNLTHKGLAGPTVVTDPSVDFTYESLPNRVNVPDGTAFAMNKLRMKSITTESGTQITVNYLPAECTPSSLPGAGDAAAAATNNMRCMPVYFTRDGGENPTLHWFHKYPVSSYIEADLSTDSPDTQTTYEYAGKPAWHYDDNELTLPKYRTWGDWRGYGTVVMRSGLAGAQSKSKYLYFRGMHSDRANLAGTATKTVVVEDSQGGSHYDYPRLNGVQREQISYNRNAQDVEVEVEGSISTPWIFTSGSGGGHVSQLLGTKSVRSRTRLANGTYRVTGVDTEFDTLGMPIAVSDSGDVTKSADDRCTRHTYNRNPELNITTTISRTETVSAACDAATSRPADVVSDTLTFYDGNPGRTTPPAKGLVTEVQTMSGWTTGPVYEQRSRTTYDSYGRTKETFDALDRRTSLVDYTPAAAGPVTGVKTTDAKGFTNQTTMDPAWGSTLTEVDANNKRTEMSYDASGRLLWVWLPDRSKAAGHNASMAFSYKLSKSEPNVVVSSELLPDASYKTSRTLLDGMLRKRQIQTPGANGVGRLVVDTRYDPRGNVKTDAGPFYNAASGPVNELFDVPEQNLPSQTVHHYDDVNREIINVYKVQNAERWRTNMTFNGDSVSVDPPSGGTATTTLTDARGKTTELRQYHNGTTSGTYDSTTYTYTHRDELATVTNEAGSVWRYGYDIRGRQTSAVDPDKGTSTSTYDALDQVVSTKDGRNQSIFFSYDDLGRKTAVRKDTSTGALLASWAYDTLGKGLLTSSTRYSGGASYVSAINGYDAIDRPTSTTTTIPATEGKLAGTYTTSTEYNVDGSIKQATLPNLPGLPPETLRLGYDNAGNPQNLSGWSNYMADVVRSSYGEPLRYALASEVDKFVWQSFTYEEGTRRGTEMKVQRAGQANPDDTFGYNYDPAGNLKAVAHTSVAGIDRQCVQLDHLRRMTESWTPSGGTCTTGPAAQPLGGPLPYWKTYSYSPSGNRTKVVDHKAATTTNYTYPGATAARPHGVTGTSTSGPSGTAANTYSYDGAGNLASRTEGGDTDTFAWDPEGHLASVSGPTGAADTTSFVYDAEGSRLIKRDPTGSTLYLPSGEVRLDKATDKAAGTRYYQFDGQTIAMRTSDVAVEFLLADHHNTATVSIDAYSQTLSRRWQDPFGNTRFQNPTWEKNAHGFVDGKMDTSIGLTHLGAREYDPALGRFISVDPLMDNGDPQTLNSYAYGKNNPLTFSDADGLAAQVDLPNGDSMASGNPDATYKHHVESKKRAKEIRSRPPSVKEQFEKAVSHHKEQKEKAKAKIKRAVQDLVKLIADELGITDALNCAMNGDVSSCFATGITILTSLAGGLAGKIAAKYGAPWKWKKAAALIGKIGGLIDEAIDGVKGLRKAENEMQAAACAINSFVPGTLVLLADGTSKPIEKVVLGDKVVATDPASGQSSAEPVVATIIGSGKKQLVDLSLKTTSPDGSTSTAKVTATEGHPFYLPALGKWIDAGDLITGSQLQALNSKQSVVVSSTRHYTALARVHNLTVANIHTYYVATDGASSLTHNCGRAGMNFTSRDRELVYATNFIKFDGVLTCEYCGKEVVRRQSQKGVTGKADDAQIDHQDPKSRGGHGGIHNARVSCRECNRDKSDTPYDDWVAQRDDLFNDD
ncbi:hypothetical protein E1263_07540 [Kribbella antibiotica]|uniref:Hint domain-containing protein n=1 Tax=Kribbella antibiotica TaxID=190195 RepID=A0A4R4ZTB3_9ACTN|nr:RHS repeat-associated core domain-containing protein [Kribbella antibiotica]TDD61354.1 hypothetical protein E1263_07540 [Kribbella antibiotica]